MAPLHSLLPLSLLLSIFTHLLPAHAIIIPLEGRAGLPSHPRLRYDRRAEAELPLKNNGNAQYIANATLAGETVRLLLDTGSSDLWISWPSSPPSSTDLGQSLGLNYAIGSASGNIHAADFSFGGFQNKNQAFLQVEDASSFSMDIHQQGYDGLLGLGPNAGSQVRDKLDDKNVKTTSYDSPITRIFQQNGETDNFITLLLDRIGDPSGGFTGQFTISEVLSNYSDVTKMPKMDVAEVYKLLEEDQHWQALTDKDNGIIGPDGKIIEYKSIVPKAPRGRLVVVFDSGFTFNQVPRDIADAIYGRVQGAKYDEKNEWWTVPCGQYLNISFNFGGKNYPIHPLDTVDNNFGITDASGNSVCIGSFQPITTAFSILGNYDMIMGMSFMRNVYTLMDFGDWASDTDDSGDPYVQLLALTDPAKAKADFITQRMAGKDATGDQKYQLLPADQMQKSPVSAEEKKKKYQEMVLSRWPYILVGSLVGLILIIGIVIWKCCCKRKKQPKEGDGMFGPQAPKDTYVQLQPSHSQATLTQPYDTASFHSQQSYPNKGYMQHQPYHG